MSYADDLRRISQQAGRKKECTYRDRVNDIVKNYTPAILKFCSNAAKAGKRGIKGYLRLQYDTEYQTVYYVDIVDISPEVFTQKPITKNEKFGYIPYNKIISCAVKFSENEQELLDGMLLLQKGFTDALFTAGFHKLSISVVTAPRYDTTKGLIRAYVYKKNPNLNYHLLHVDIQW